MKQLMPLLSTLLLLLTINSAMADDIQININNFLDETGIQPAGGLKSLKVGGKTTGKVNDPDKTMKLGFKYMKKGVRVTMYREKTNRLAIVFIDYKVMQRITVEITGDENWSENVD